MRLRFWASILALLFLFTWNGQAQTINVVERGTLQPIPNVYIHNSGQNKMTATDAEGRASIQKFSVSDTLHFTHPSFKKVQILYSKIEQQQFRVELETKAHKMDDIYVSASRRPEDRSRIPQPIIQLSQQEVAFNNPQTAADLIEQSGRVFVQKSQMGGGSPMIRGFSANSVLLSVDGVRMNNAIFRSGNIQNVISVDPNTIENTEVLFGPGAVIYGSDALGGVMNFQTLQPKLSYSDSTVHTINTMTRYSSANNEQTVHADVSLGFEDWGSVTSVTYSNFDDLKSGDNFYDDYPDFGKRNEYVIRRDGRDAVVTNDDVTKQRFSGYEQLNVMQKIRYKPTPDWNLGYSFHLGTTSDIPRYDRLIQREQGDTGQLVNAEWYYGPQIWMQNTARVDYLNSSKMFDNLTATFSHQWFQESRNDRNLGDDWLRNREENVNVYIAQLDFDKHFSEDKELYYGIEGIYNFVASDASETNISTGQQNAVSTRYPSGGSDYTQLAAYAKYEQDLSSKITAVAGSRYSHILLDARLSDQFYNFDFQKITLNTGALSGNLGVTYRPTQMLQFNANASTGFRAPNVDDVAKVFDSEPGTVVVPNADLTSEKTYNLDVAVIKKFGDKARIEVNGFYTWLRDVMVRRDFGDSFGQDSIIYDGTLSNVEAVVNAGKAYIYGISAGISAEPSESFLMEGQLTYTEGNDQSSNEPLRHVAPLFGRVSITYQADPLEVQIYTIFNDEKPISDFAPSERNKPHLYTADGSPGWVTLNLKTAYQLSEEITLNLGIENIFDQHYRPYSSGISAAGRNIRATIRTNFK